MLILLHLPPPISQFYTYVVLHGKTSDCGGSQSFMSFNLLVCVFMRYRRCLNNILHMTAIWRMQKETSPTEQQ